MRWKRVLSIFVLFGILGTGVFFLSARMEREAPTISFESELKQLGRKTEWSFVAEDRKSGLRQVRLWIRQGQKDREALAEDFPAGGWMGKGATHRYEASLTFEPEQFSLSDGAATVIIAAQDHSIWGFGGNNTFREIPLYVDTVPPRIDLLSTTHNVKKGGTGLVTFRLNEEPDLAGVQIGEHFFTAYPEETGGEGVYLAFFAIAHDAADETVPVLTVADSAGNEARRPVSIRLLKRKTLRDTIHVSDGFLKRKVPEFQALDPSLDSNLLKAYLTVNREWRRKNHDKIREICMNGHSQRLWSGPFMQMENTKNMAPYAVRRKYMYNGKSVDQQDHLGLDLASTAGASVPAANTGIVVMADNLGIYGQTVMIDHGQGLFSLYSHLSGISATLGEMVERGRTIGYSGQTGMAGGDHLHFSILASGEFVNPVEWLDAHWIADNVENKLNSLVGLPSY